MVPRKREEKLCVPVTAARVFRAEAFADGLTNDDGNDGDGYDVCEDGKERRRGDRVAADILLSVAVKHRFFLFAMCDFLI